VPTTAGERGNIIVSPVRRPPRRRNDGNLVSQFTEFRRKGMDVKARCRRFAAELAETASEFLLLVDRDFLVTEEDDVALGNYNQ
jgi:hypothetical protein